MNLKEVLGDAYKDGMSFEEVSNFFEGKKFADLSTGNYVDKNKYESEVNDLKSQLAEKVNELKDKLSDEERLALAQKEKDDEIENLKQLLTANTINGNKNTVNGITLSIRDTLGIKTDDNEFSKFVDNITTKDSDKSTSIATYVTKLVKDAYEKGKKDAVKDNMGGFGKGKGYSGNDGDDKKEQLGEFGKRLANLSYPKKEKYDYFKTQ